MLWKLKKNCAPTSCASFKTAWAFFVIYIFLNQKLELIESSNSRIEIAQIFHLLSQEKFEFPPGGGFFAK